MSKVNILNGIKSKYILAEIFKNLSKDKYFKIINYNKNIQQKLDLQLTDYINYYEELLKIEIEIFFLTFCQIMK